MNQDKITSGLNLATVILSLIIFLWSGYLFLQPQTLVANQWQAAGLIVLMIIDTLLFITVKAKSGQKHVGAVAPSSQSTSSHHSSKQQ